MGSDRGDARTRETRPGVRAQQRPPKPNRPRAAPAIELAARAVDEDETTIRLLLESGEALPSMTPDGEPSAAVAPWPGLESDAHTAPLAVDVHEMKTVRPPAPPDPIPLPPPLPGWSKTGDQATPLALEVPKTQAAARPFATREQFVRIGAAIFAVGVLVGVIGSVIVLATRTPRPLEAMANVSAASAPRPAPRAASTPAPIERAGKPRPLPEVEAEDGTGSKGKEPASSLISSSSAPSCRQLLGDGVVERDDPKAAARETRLANRELVRGNTSDAQKAYCRALAWDRSNVDRHVNLGRLFLVRRDWKQAGEYGHSALELEPKDRRALAVVGDAAAALQKTGEARSAWLSLEKSSKASASALGLVVRRNMALAQRVERLKDFSLAERIYRRVLLFSPDHVGATKGIASCLLKIGDYPAAEAWAQRAKALRQSKKGSRGQGTPG